MKLTKVKNKTKVEFGELEEGNLFKTTINHKESIFLKGSGRHASRVVSTEGLFPGSVCSFNDNFQVIPVKIVEVKYKEV